jgi:ABC-type phosphate transport system substrate-binding protein
LFKHLTRFGLVAGALGMSTLMLASCGGPPKQIINLVGSDTIQDVMGAIANNYNASSQSTADNATVHNSLAVNAGVTTVPGDNVCASFTYDATVLPPGSPAPNQAPNGSGAGITALQNQARGNGCTDVARSSRGPNGTTDNPNDQFFAFAKDAVTWSGFTGGNQPANLTQAQLQGIYECTNAGDPTITNWNQVGGGNGTIVRYLPQKGSGTLSFFETKVLGLTSAQQGVIDDSSCNTAPVRIEENHGNEVAGGDQANAVFPYSFAVWTAQHNGVVTDARGGAILKSINGVAPSATTINATVNPFLGRRWVYNVLAPTLNSAQYSTSIKIVGVTASRVGWVCLDNTTIQNTISQYGFVTNPLGTTGTGLPSSHCRLNPTPL